MNGHRYEATISPPSASNPIPRQRVHAAGSITSKRGAGSELDALHQSGGAKIRLPRSEPSALSAVLLNTAGGLTGDDEIRWHAAAGAGSRLSVATAASEKVYRTHGPPARQRTNLAVEAGARLDWLPQETILFDGSRLERSLHAELAADATLLIAEAIAFGRRASGETLRTVGARDRWRVYRGGDLLHAESFRLDEMPRRAEEDGDSAPGVTRPAALSRGTLHGVGAMATVLYCSPAGTEALDALADELHAIFQPSSVASGARGDIDSTSTKARTHAGASAMEGRIVLRLLAPSSFELRRILLPCLARLQGDVPLPRVWHV